MALQPHPSPQAGLPLAPVKLSRLPTSAGAMGPTLLLVSAPQHEALDCAQNVLTSIHKDEACFYKVEDSRSITHILHLSASKLPLVTLVPDGPLPTNKSASNSSVFEVQD